jgi:hypothetical protein
VLSQPLVRATLQSPTAMAGPDRVLLKLLDVNGETFRGPFVGSVREFLMSANDVRFHVATAILSSSATSALTKPVAEI